jgi:hypothetical protein
MGRKGRSLLFLFPSCGFGGSFFVGWRGSKQVSLVKLVRAMEEGHDRLDCHIPFFCFSRMIAAASSLAFWNCVPDRVFLDF